MKKALVFLVLTIMLLMCFSSCKKEKHVHNFGNWSTAITATCTENGVEECYCSCGEKETRAIEAIGHVYGEWNTLTNATCTEEGEQARQCILCESKETQSLPLQAHDYSVVTNISIDGKNYVETSCSYCKNVSDLVLEGGFSSENETVFLKNCETDFSFDVLCSEDAYYLYENITIVESFISESSPENIEQFADAFNATQVNDTTWRITPQKSFLSNTGYTVILGDEITFANFPGKTINFRTAKAENVTNVAVTTGDILFLRNLEDADPGYYPYTIEFDKENTRFILTLNKQGVFTDELIGRILCVGECTDMEEAFKLSSDDVDMGKIQEIKEENGKTIVFLGAVGFEDIFSSLNASFSEMDSISADDLSDKDKRALVNSLLTNESFLAQFSVVQTAVKQYALDRGLTVDDITWEEVYGDLLESIRFIAYPDKDNVPENQYKIIAKIGFDDFDIDFKIKHNDSTVCTISFTFTWKEEFEFLVDGTVSKSNVLEFAKDKFAIWDKDDTVLNFYAEIDFKATTTFNFGIKIKADVVQASKYYVVTPSSKKIHSSHCVHASKHLYDDDCNYTLTELIGKFGENYADHQCKVCNPFKKESFFVINASNGVIHRGNCDKVSMMNEENMLISYIHPTAGGEFGANKYSYCGSCHPEEIPSKEFDEYMKEVVDGNNWDTTLSHVASQIASERLELTSNNPKKHTYSVKIWILEFAIDIRPDIEFKVTADIQFNYVEIKKERLVAELKYTEDSLPYIDQKIIEVALTSEELHARTSSLDFVGSFDAKVGVEVTLSVGPAVISEWFNVYFDFATGVYAEIGGIAHIEFMEPEESYGAGYVDMGLYLTIDASYTVFGQSPKKPLGLVDLKFSMFSLGDSIVYYGFCDYEQELNVKNNKMFTLDESILKASYYDLREKKKELGGLSFITSEQDGYKLSISFADENGNKVDYITIKNDELYISDNAPEYFTVYMVINVIDTDPVEWSDLTNPVGFDDLGTYYTLPQMTVKITGYSDKECLHETVTTTVISEATCTESGMIEKKCTCCGYSVTEILERLEHNYIDGKCTICNHEKVNITIPIDAIEHNGHYYKAFYYNNITWQEAKKICEEYGGYLSVITSEEEQGFVQSLVVDFSYACWLGGYFDGENWKWITGESFVFTNWDDDEPSLTHGGNYEDCLGIYANDTATSWSTTGKWNDFWCKSTTPRGFVCEWNDNSNFENDEDSNETPIYSEGLEFTSNGDGTCCVSGTGTCTDIDIIIPPTSPSGDKVTAINQNAFYNCDSLTSVITGDNVTSIGEGAFYSCDNLTSVVISNSVTTIGEYAFSWCSLTSVILGNNLTSIGEFAFSSCESLSSIIIPNSVTTIGNCAFQSCKSLGSVTLGSNVTSIGNGAFQSCAFSSIIISNNVVSIGNHAFSYCENLTSLVLPNSVTYFGSNALQSCTSLTFVVLSDNLTSIGSYTFQSCKALTYVVIGKNISNIGFCAFSNCPLLSNIYYKGTQDDWGKINIGLSNNHLTNAKLNYNYTSD